MRTPEHTNNTTRASASKSINEFFYQRSVVEFSQIGHTSPPIKLFGVDVVDVAAALFLILFILPILIFISINIKKKTLSELI